MRYLAMTLLVLALVGCGSPQTGFTCRDCGSPVSQSAASCPKCGASKPATSSEQMERLEQIKENQEDIEDILRYDL